MLRQIPMIRTDRFRKTKNVFQVLSCLLCLSSMPSAAQFPRINDPNFINWFVYEGTHQLTAKWALRTEYQWRRADFLKKSQQNLLRLGIVRSVSSRIDIAAGYTNFQSFRYGSYPEVTDRPEPENRIYEDISLKDRLGIVNLEHRVRLEQRWLGSRDETGRSAVQEWEYQNRIRYQLSAELPLQGTDVEDHEWYLNAFDEVFIGFGKNVEYNVFNQNRLSAGLGYQFAPTTKIELNYLYQIRQHATPDPATGRSVLEQNQGLRLTVIYGLDFVKRQ